MASWKDDLNITIFSTDLNYQFDAFSFEDSSELISAYEGNSYYFWLRMTGVSFKHYIDKLDTGCPEFMLRIRFNGETYYSYCKLVELYIMPYGHVTITNAMFRPLHLDLYSWNTRIKDLSKFDSHYTTTQRSKAPLPTIVNVWYNNPYTTVVWSDDTITKAKCKEGDIFDRDAGLSICIAKKYYQYMGYNSFAKALKDTNDKSVDVPKRQAQTMARKMHKKLSLGLTE